jgi:hypothetical protein
MSRKFIVTIAAVAALGMSTLAATDASARFGGGGFGGGHMGGGHVASFSRASFHPARINTSRTVTRSIHPTHFTRFSRVNRPVLHRPDRFHFARYHGHHWWVWCRHHHHHFCGYPWIDVGVGGGDVAVEGVTAAPQAVAATPAAVCNDCDYFLKDEPGCYMAKRAFSTPAGDEELRCVKICEEPESPHAAK